ncbi:ricin-type beta-trefoil lectin domain protein [Streptomyces sp. PKU-MA01144]|uniref:ricin-type beta-trefoil lectin domain protein n=1 Tax=Streptomyces sp. PKU-MA01144 TaxID=2729138 RepID=UPI00147E9F2C|nr:ricin-type beta-trefoil lectin domain protein [Streptomyces sp. PKU-MA01144]NNJ05734.1 ricin-type beta-trefoil lectin domain protein [Streptomyces sp. PKU-MA01144]
MPELQKAVSTTASWESGCANATDSELAERVRSQGPVDHRAESELNQRHLAYAVVCSQLCTRGRVAADRLAREALKRAAEAARSGVDPSGTWRDFVLTCVHHTALSWARGGRRALLAPSFLSWADGHGESGADGHSSGGRPAGPPAKPGQQQALREGFFALPEAARGVLWYSLVDREPDERVATYVGVAPGDVPALRARARESLHAALLQAHAERAGDTRCNGFRRLVEAAAVAGDSPRCGDLALHLDTCPACDGLLTQLILLADDLRTALADGLLVLDGAAYASAVARGLHTPDSGPPPSGGAEDGGGAMWDPGPADRPLPRRRPGRGVRVAGAVAAVAVVSLPLLLVAERHSGEQPGPGRGRAEDRPSASASPSGATTAPTQPESGSTAPPGALVYGRIVHAGSGLCLDIEDGVIVKRGGTVVARCTQATTQRWAPDAQGRLRNLHDSTFCLKADGDDAEVGVRPCDSDNPEKLGKMAFLLEPVGPIRPKSDPKVALVPDPDWVVNPRPLELRAATGGSDQRWTVESLASPTRGGAAARP